MNQDLVKQNINFYNETTDFTLIDSKEIMLADNTPVVSNVFTIKFEGRSYKVMDINALKNNIRYSITYSARVDSYNDYLPIVQKMIDSLKITTLAWQPIFQIENQMYNNITDTEENFTDTTTIGNNITAGDFTTYNNFTSSFTAHDNTTSSLYYENGTTVNRTYDNGTYSYDYYTAGNMTTGNTTLYPYNYSNGTFGAGQQTAEDEGYYLNGDRYIDIVKETGIVTCIDNNYNKECDVRVKCTAIM